MTLSMAIPSKYSPSVCVKLYLEIEKLSRTNQTVRVLICYQL